LCLKDNQLLFVTHCYNTELFFGIQYALSICKRGYYMRYAVIEILPPASPDSLPILKWVATDLSLSSANDAIRAWGYQAGQKGGYMECIEDSQNAFDARKRDANLYSFYSKRTLGSNGKPLNIGE
jgi:hypothetical protein